MKTLILDGAHPHDDEMAARLNQALREQLQARGWQVEHILLREQKIGNCAGDFFCWVRSPGICNTNDDNRAIAAKIVQCDLLVYLTPVTFGGYSSALKQMVDHQIQNISPYFTRINGETHHEPRYRRYPDMLVVGWMDEPDAASEAILRQLARRNALNMYARTTVCDLLSTGQTDNELATRAGGWLEAVARGASTAVPELPVAGISLGEGRPPQRAVLLVGSPRTTKSTSASLGGYLMEQLAGHGVETQTIQLYTSFNNAAKREATLAALDAADLIVLAFPLYVDSLPAPVVAALEALTRQRAGRRSGQHFVAISNCGFPEAHHTAAALASCALFARQAGLEWAGGLAFGGGGLISGTPLSQMDGRVHVVRKALTMAAAELAAGRGIPTAAAELMARPAIPNWLYLLVGQLGWGQMAKQYGAQKELKRRPYQE